MGERPDDLDKRGTTRSRQAKIILGSMLAFMILALLMAFIGGNA